MYHKCLRCFCLDSPHSQQWCARWWPCWDSQSLGLCSGPKVFGIQCWHEYKAAGMVQEQWALDKIVFLLLLKFFLGLTLSGVSAAGMLKAVSIGQWSEQAGIEADIKMSWYLTWIILWMNTGVFSVPLLILLVRVLVSDREIPALSPSFCQCWKLGKC